MAFSFPSLGIGHIALRCSDIDEMERFYRDVLGYDLVWSPEPSDRYLTNGYDNLALHACGDVSATSDSRLDHFGILVETPDDVDAWAAHLAASGTKVDTGPKTHRDGSRSLYFSDPEGNRIQIIHLGPGVRKRT